MEPPTGERFPKRSRLIRSQDFVKTKRGQRRAGAALIVWSAKNGLTWPRLGLAVSRKVGKANARNQLKRRTREMFRRGLAPFADGYDYVVVFKIGAADLGFSELQAELGKLLGGRAR